MSTIYRGMDRAALDAAYNNSAAVADSAAIMQQCEARSARWREQHGERLGLAYGPKPRNLIDYFAAPAPGPLLVFIHGGYWQMRAKEHFSFMAAGPVALGMHVAMIGYTLAPDATLAEIVAEARASIAWLRAHAGAFGADVDRIVVSGWSAGGHLTAMCLDQPGVVGGLAISGIYDLEPVRLCYTNDKLRLGEADVAALSPQRLPVVARPLTIAYGTAELPELQRQSREFFGLRAGAGRADTLMPLPGRNHFTILSDMDAADAPLAKAARALAG